LSTRWARVLAHNLVKNLLAIGLFTAATAPPSIMAVFAAAEGRSSNGRSRPA
jgi:hypothetical protein